MSFLSTFTYKPERRRTREQNRIEQIAKMRSFQRIKLDVLLTARKQAKWKQGNGNTRESESMQEQEQEEDANLTNWEEDQETN